MQVTNCVLVSLTENKRLVVSFEIPGDSFIQLGKKNSVPKMTDWSGNI